MNRGRLRGTAIAGTSLAFVAFIGLIAYGPFVTRLGFGDLYLPSLLIGAAIASPVVVTLVLAARARGVPWPWLLVAIGWGLFGAAWMAVAGETIVTTSDPWLNTPWLAPGTGPETWPDPAATFVAPIVEEPAKLLGTVFVLLAARRSGARVGPALGAAVGGLVGLAFGLSEVAHRITSIVLELGFTDTSGAFIVDWDLIHRLSATLFTSRLFLLGATNHALFSAAAGVAVALWLTGRRWPAIGWLGAAALGHGLLNSVGTLVGGAVFERLVTFLAGAWPSIAVFAPAWLAGATSFVVAEAWLAVLLVRRLRRGGRALDSTVPAEGPATLVAFGA